MSGITSGIGLISGIDSQSLIQQLLSLDARPKLFAQRRVIDLQAQQAAYLDINSRLSTLKTAAAKFRTANIFNSATATSSNTDVLTASASASAALGSYSFIVDRVVQTQQALSRGFADRNVSSVGVSGVTLESSQGRLIHDVELASLNGGAGVSRGEIIITDRSGATERVDLSRVGTIDDVLEAINSAGSVRVNARIDGSRLVIEDESGGSGSLIIADESGSETAADLGIAGTGVAATLTGSVIHAIGDSTSLASLNDGNGILFNPQGGTTSADFTIKTRDGTTYSVDIGQIFSGTPLVETSAAVATVGALRQRILDQTGGKVTVGVSADGRGLTLTDSSTPTGSDDFQVIDIHGGAAGLGLVGTTSGASIDGSDVLSDINSTLLSNLRGGSGLTSGAISITARDGSVHNLTLDVGGSVSTLLAQFGTLTGGDITAALNEQGTAIVLTDTTAGSGNLILQGTLAEQLGVDTAITGVAASSVTSERQQHRYIAESTLLSTLNAGSGVGTGRFEILDTNGRRAEVDIGTDSRTLDDVIREINSRGLNVRARINDNGDGIIFEADPGEAQGNVKIKITDLSGAVARNLNIAGEAEGAGTSNFIDGSLETTIELDGADTLDDLVAAINDAGGPVTASIINDGSTTNPFRLKLTSRRTGEAGAFVIDVAGGDLGLSTLSEARNARVFFGSDDPARAILVSSTNNSIDNVLEGVRIDLTGTDPDPVTLTVSRDNAAIETAVDEFLDAFNGVAARVATLTSYNAETEQRGTLLGDSTAQELRRRLFDEIQRPAFGVGSAFRRLSDVGIRIGSGTTVTVDKDKLREAIEEDPQGVADLFAGYAINDRPETTEVSPGITVNNTAPNTFRVRGVAEQLAGFIDSYISASGGLLTRRRDALQEQITLQERRIEQIDIRLASREQYYIRQFAALEQSLSQLQQQQNSLGSLGIAR